MRGIFTVESCTLENFSAKCLPPPDNYSWYSPIDTEGAFLIGIPYIESLETHSLIAYLNRNISILHNDCVNSTYFIDTLPLQGIVRRGITHIFLSPWLTYQPIALKKTSLHLQR